jgi:hypothetical protein
VRDGTNQLLMPVARAALVLSVLVWLASAVGANVSLHEYAFLERLAIGRGLTLTRLASGWLESASPTVKWIIRAASVGGHAFALVLQAAGAVAAIAALGQNPSLRTFRGVALGVVSCGLDLVLAFFVFLVLTTRDLL